jgi:hypothetical protein
MDADKRDERCQDSRLWVERIAPNALSDGYNPTARWGQRAPPFSLRLHLVLGLFRRSFSEGGSDPFYAKIAKRRWNSAIKRKNSIAWPCPL